MKGAASLFLDIYSPEAGVQTDSNSEPDPTKPDTSEFPLFMHSL